MDSIDRVPPPAPLSTIAWRRDEAMQTLRRFGVVIAIAVATIPLGPAPRSWLLVGLGVALAPAIFAAEALLPWERLPSALHVVPPLVTVVAIELVRHTSGGSASGYAPLFALPVVWVALYCTRGHVAVVAVAIAGAFASDLGRTHGAFDGAELRHAILWAAVALLVGFAIRSLVMRGSEQVETAEALAAQLRRSEHEFGDLVRASRDAIVRFGPDGVFRYLSPAAADVYGWPVEELVGTSALARLHPDDLPRMLAGGLGNPEDGPESTLSTFRFERRDGTYGWLEGYRVAIRDASGRVVEFHSTVRNVTGRKDAEEEHRLAEVRFEHAFTNAPIGVALVGVDGAFQTANEALCRILGRSEDELTSTTFQQLTHPDDLDADLELMRDVLAGARESYALEKRYIRPDGSFVPARLHVSLVRDPDGKPLYFIAQIVDVSELTAALEAVRSSEARYRGLLAAAPVAVVETDDHGNCVFVNDAWVELSGLTFERSRDLGWLLAVHLDDVKGLFDARRTLLEGTTAVWEHEYRLVRPDGRVVWLASRAVPIVDENGVATGYLSTGQDVTERHLTEERLRESEASLRTVAAAIRAVRSTDDARTSLCLTVESVAAAAAVTLLEPAPEGMTATASTERGFLGRTVDRDEPTGANVVLDTTERFVIDDLDRTPELCPSLAGLGLRGCVFEPVTRDGALAGVMSVAWRHPLTEVSSATLESIGLLAQEAATVIERGDVLARLDELSRRDALTGLENRRVWDDELPRAIATAGRTGRALSIAMIDLDHFKRYNDTRGHQAGDDLLAATADSWAHALRRGDRLVRYGGEEFALLLPECDLATASAVADRFRGLVTDGQTCSVGVAQWRPGEDADALFARADSALYRAKNGGRDRVALAAA